MRIEPQPGPQTDFLASDADIKIIGGAAGGGKSWALRMDGLRGHEDPHFRGVIFRKTMPAMLQADGMWSKAVEEYGRLGATPFRGSPRRLDFPSGAEYRFTHAQNDDVLARSHMGAEYTWVGLDELLDFTEHQFWLLFGRLRSPRAAWRPWMSATTNPRFGTWVHRLVSWWIGPDGYADPERAGVKRWFVRRDGLIHWVDEDYRDPETGDPPRSLAFFPAYLEDNDYLGPEYRATLRALDKVEADRLWGGSWHARSVDGIFAHHEVDPDGVFPEMVPWDELVGPVRSWDLADTEPSASNQEPDETASAKGYLHIDPVRGETLYLVDSTAAMLSGDAKRAHIRRVAASDGLDCEQVLEREGGASGKEIARDYKTTHLAGFPVRFDAPRVDKVSRARRWLPLAETGRVVLVRPASGERPDWFGAWLAQVESFDGSTRRTAGPDGRRRKRDRVDATSQLYARLKALTTSPGFWSTLLR